MRLVSVTLTNVRRFCDPVRVGGIGPGLNVLTAPNEQGKSTLFDALQALFFLPHRSQAQEIRALQPHAGGAPEVVAEVDLPEGRFRIAKRWLSRPAATVHRGEVLVAQADEAEAWIARLTRAEAAGGPTGLLWVRQGLTALDAGSDREQKAAEAARRDLMSSVTGEIEALTGGRRMDRALARVRDDLGRYLTPTGRPKTGGPLAEALAAQEALAARKAELEAQVQALGAALARRHAGRKALAELTDPEAVALRAARLAEAAGRHETASRHAAEIGRARTALEIADLRRAQATERLAGFRRDRAALVAATEARAAAERTVAEARTALAAAETDLERCAAGLDAARTAETAATATLAAARRAEAARLAAERRTELEGRLERARALMSQRAARAPAAAAGPDAAALAKLEALARAADLARELRVRGAARYELRHDGPARAKVLGIELPEVAAQPILAETRIALPGLGSLTLWPADSGAAADRPDAAQAALARALAAAGLPDIAAARQLAAVRAEAAADLQRIDAELALVAPKGVAALEADLAALPAAPGPEAADLPRTAEAEAAAAAAVAARAAAEGARDTARDRAGSLRTALARAEAALAAAEADRAARAAALAAHGEAAAAEAALDRAAAAAAARHGEAAAALAALEADAPDLAAAAAALARARSVEEAAATEAARLREDLAALDREIALRSGEGIAEELADVTARLHAAEERARLIGFEVEVLKCLLATLEAARTTARERYFEPVLSELRPLLRLLWPDAEIGFDDRRLLPAVLVRGGTGEAVGILSGGTQEQVALLVRLAFARLLAKAGRPAPVILDDALVFTDDDRIEAMFDALTRQAEDLQILVLSCRQRAFRALGGTPLRFEPARGAPG